MPGRGRFWEVGALNDEIVEEADLTQALQTKVNAVGGGGGSGNVEVVLDAVAPSNLVSHTFNFDRTIAMNGSDIGLLKIIISPILMSASTDVFDVGLNGDTTGINSKGVKSDGTTVSAVGPFESPITTGVNQSVGGSMIIDIPGDIANLGNDTGAFAKMSDSLTYANVRVDFQSSAFDPLVSITIKSRGGVVTVNTGTRVVAYAFNKD